MTYCLAITVDDGLVFASDSRTNAGVDHVATYSKMHCFGIDGQCQFVVLSAGNLATTQAVVAQMKQDISLNAARHLFNVAGVGDAAEYLGEVLRRQQEKHGEAVMAAGFSADASFIIGGQVGTRSPKIYLVYPQGNYITTSSDTPFLQIGESKYGKSILDRIIDADTDLDKAARCALVSIDSTIRSNATVGPPVELMGYVRDSLTLDHYLKLDVDDDYLLDVKRAWNEQIVQAFNSLPHFQWHDRPAESQDE